VEAAVTARQCLPRTATTSESTTRTRTAFGPFEIDAILCRIAFHAMQAVFRSDFSPENPGDWRKGPLPAIADADASALALASDDEDWRHGAVGHFFGRMLGS
jgi:hypothetical protein